MEQMRLDLQKNEKKTLATCPKARRLEPATRRQEPFAGGGPAQDVLPVWQLKGSEERQWSRMAGAGGDAWSRTAGPGGDA
jgi:hypothetical protein